MPKAGIQFSKKDEWYTPKEVVDFFGTFDYDPATTKEQADELGIRNYDTISTDGLKKDWSKYDKIWINPPFTRKFEFLEKAVKCGSHVFFLLPIETLTTKRFHEICKGGGILCGSLTEELNLTMETGRLAAQRSAQLFWNCMGKEK